MKKVLAFVLTLAIVLTCAMAMAEELVDGRFPETKHITVEIFNRYNDGGTDPTSNVFAEYIKKGMLERYNVEVEFQSIGRWTEVDDLNTALAAGTAPDVCVTYSYPTIQTYAAMGGVINLNDINGKKLEEYKDLLPNL
ncbi:MAG: extracellular solute-binding protein, partial [Clostridia bacterium]|nr:extracellular solute-binding protein [Clostridia bacterium]